MKKLLRSVAAASTIWDVPAHRRLADVRLARGSPVAPAVAVSVVAAARPVSLELGAAGAAALVAAHRIAWRDGGVGWRMVKSVG